jgi:hypothetical protein
MVKNFLTEPCLEKPPASLRIDRLYSFTQDPLVALDERTTLDWVEKLKDTQLFGDYLELFSAIIDPTDKQELIGIRASVTKTGRIFEQNPETGVLLNLADRTRNIALRADTFSSVLFQLAGHLRNEELRLGLSEIEAKHVADQALRQTGFVCGSNFAKKLSEKWKDENRKLSVNKKLKEWSTFDSDVGFGVFKIVLRGKSSHIRLANSFLHDTKEHSNVNVLAFIEGYVEGVIKELTDGKVEIQRMDVMKPRIKDSKDRVDIVFDLKLN